MSPPLPVLHGIHVLVCDMTPPEMKALRARYADNPDGWRVIEQARATPAPDCRSCGGYRHGGAVFTSAKSETAEPG